MRQAVLDPHQSICQLTLPIVRQGDWLGGILIKQEQEPEEELVRVASQNVKNAKHRTFSSGHADQLHSGDWWKKIGGGE